MELDHLGDDGPKPALGGGAAAGGTALFVLVCTLTAFLFSGQSLGVAAGTFFGWCYWWSGSTGSTIATCCEPTPVPKVVT